MAGSILKMCRGKGIPGMSTLREQLAAAVAALLDVMPEGEPLEHGLQRRPEGEVLKALSLIGQSRRLIDAVGARYCGDLDRRDDDVLDAGDPLPTRMGERTLAEVAAREAGVPLTAAQNGARSGPGSRRGGACSVNRCRRSMASWRRRSTPGS